jgi:hypothetical protein
MMMTKDLQKKIRTSISGLPFFAFILLCIVLFPGKNIAQENKNVIGMNLSGPMDWEECFIFADAMMQSRNWTDCTVDLATGWPTSDGEIIVAHNEHMHGTYKLKFTGNADISFSDASVSNKVYDPATNTTTADVVVTRTDKIVLRLNVTNSNGGIKDVKLMRPISPGSNTPHGFDELFHRELETFITEGFNLIRFMDLLGTNSDNFHLKTDFSYRLTPNYATQAANWHLDNYQKKTADDSKYFRYQGIGAAFEYVILMCNQFNVDCWISISHCATDERIRKVAQLFKYGSDGTNPYTSPQANPEYPPLASHLKLYVEYSNETWNPIFPAFDWIYRLNNKGDLDFRLFNAKRPAEISLIFRDVFGDDEMMTRVRPLFEWQRGWKEEDRGNAQGTGTRGLMWVENNMPNPVNYYFWGGGGSGYYSPAGDATLENVWDSEQMNPQTFIEPRQEYIGYITAAFGIRNCVYEGGPSFGNEYGGSGNNPIGEEILNDPRMADEVVEHQTAWNNLGGNAFANFVLSGDHRWGWIQQPNIPNKKWDGAKQILGKEREPITYGTRVRQGQTSTIQGNRWKVTSENDGKYGWDNENESDAAYTVASGDWVSYPFHVIENGRLAVRVLGSGATVGLYDGSTHLADVQFSGGATPWVEFDATVEYLRGLNVKGVGGNVTINQVEIKGVGQAHDYLYVNKNQISQTWEAGSQNVSISSDLNWTASSDKSWITVTPSSGSNDGEITISVSENSGSALREGTVTVSAPPASDETITVSQNYQVPTYTLTVNNGNGTGVYELGATVTPIADPVAGMVHSGWNVVNGCESSWTGIMPECDMTIEPTYDVAPPCTTIQAEDESSLQNCRDIGTSIDFGGDGSWTEWIAPEGTYNKITFTYRNGDTQDRACILTINGGNSTPVPFTPTGGWDQNGTEVVTNVLISGSDLIRLTVDGIGGPDLDYFEICGEDSLTFVSPLQKEDAEISIHPNPVTNGRLFVDISELSKQNTVVQLADITGRIVFNQIVHKIPELMIQTDQFQPGIYLLKVKNNGEQFYKKVIIK